MRLAGICAVVFGITMVCVSGCEMLSRYDEGTVIALNPLPVFPDTSQIAQLKGEQLALLYCQLCHQFPEPGMLSKRVWEQGVLPQMGLRLGITTEKDPYRKFSMYDVYTITQANIFPKEKKITEEKWQELVAYYLAHAPDSLPGNAQQQPAVLTAFRAKPVKLQAQMPALTTMLWFDSLNSQLWVASRTGQTYALNSKTLQANSTLNTATPVVAMARGQNDLQLLQIGIMDPADQPLGELMTINSQQQPSAVLTGLQRPVSLTQADLNADGTDDFIVSNFGNYVGNLTWYDGTKPYQPHALSAKPGCLRTEIYDFNQDGLPDIIALMAQGDERLVIYYNQGAGNFSEKTVLRFPPVYGSSYFELHDFNHDGYVDILYTNGDNADYSVELKPYHGVRIFENNGKNAFTETFFYPAYGVTKAIATDFDADGDLDIALVAYFADVEEHPDNGFIFLNNISATSYMFEPYTLPQAASGHWMTLETGDYDQDGDKDIALGSFIHVRIQSANAVLQQQWQESAPDVLILYNELVK